MLRAAADDDAGSPREGDDDDLDQTGEILVLAQQVRVNEAEHGLAEPREAVLVGS